MTQDTVTRKTVTRDLNGDLRQRTLTRRGFLGVAGWAVATSSVLAWSKNLVASGVAEPGSPSFHTRLFRACPCYSMDWARSSMADAAKLGFDGVEMWQWDITDEEALELRQLAEENGLRVHSVARGWTSFDQPGKREQDMDSVRKTLHVAQICGADAILLVPAAIGGPALSPWDMKVEFEADTGHLTQVVEGDNTPFAGYIQAHNETTDACRSALESLAVDAAHEGITIGLENVCNALWVTPDLLAAVIRSFHHLRIKAYLDLGNNIMYAPTQDYIHALGADNIIKMHVKDYRVDRDHPENSNFVPIGLGSVDWLATRQAMEDVGYSGWVSLEDVPGYTPEQHQLVLDDIFAGRPISVRPDKKE